MLGNADHGVKRQTHFFGLILHKSLHIQISAGDECADGRDPHCACARHQPCIRETQAANSDHWLLSCGGHHCGKPVVTEISA